MTFIRMQPVWRLIERREIAVASTVESFTGLNGELDNRYHIIARWVNGSGITSVYTLEPNGISTNQEGRALKAEFVAGPTVNVITALNLCGIQGNQFGMTESIFYARRLVQAVAQNRFILTRCVETRPTATDVFGEWNSAAWFDTTTDVTSLDIRATQTGGIGVGTVIELYKAD